MKIDFTTNLMAYIVPTVSVILIVLAIWGIKKTNKNLFRKNKWYVVLMSLTLVLLSAASIAVNMFSNVIDLYLATNQVDETTLTEAQNNSKALTETIQEEGIVLLENKDNSLPLSNNKQLNVFGIGSVSTVYGGSGSGASDESNNITIQQGLENAGFSLNPELIELYDGNKPKKDQQNNFNLTGGDYNIYEPNMDLFTDELLENAVEYSDVALVIFSRNGGEGGDLPMDMEELQNGTPGKSYLELQDIEEELLERVKGSGFENVIVVINSSNAMELGFLKDDAITASLWIGGPGSTGNNALGKILSGEVNPSGKLVDTYAYDVTTAPAYYNAGDFAYLNSRDENNRYEKFLNYNEGIYMGYRFYETRFVDNVTGEVDEEAYKELVQYPFGYGLSYTTFEQEIIDSKVEDGQITLTLKVTNTGDVAGKEVVQVYFTAPYTEGSIEKSHVVLADFAKTSLLEANASEELELSFTVDDMASFDHLNEKSYVLEKGTYEIKLMNNAHDVIDSFEYVQEENVVFNDTPRSSDNIVAETQFEHAEADLNYVSRSNWEETLPTERTSHQEASEELLAAIKEIPVEDDDSDVDITFADHGLVLSDLTGLDYDDPKWDQLLEQVSIEDMVNLIGYGGYATQAVDSVEKPPTTDVDGPAGINALLTGVTGVQFNSGTVIGSTWNMDLANQMGKAFALEALANNVVGLYAPAVNLHRTPFSGRNFEYYSEDPLLSGKMAANVTAAAIEDGVYMYVKHFAVNDQEINRLGVTTWSNEQAIRELYLKAFEIPVKEGNTTAIMSSFNRLGPVWAGADNALLNTVLRDEWGFEGMVITDYNYQWFMDADQAIRNGGDLMLTPVGRAPSELSTGTNTGRQALRQATKNILYTVANSAAVESFNQAFPWWLLAYVVVMVLVLLTFAYFLINKIKKASLTETQ
ncbi:glycoside hydrolase family 3 C-terminal domain-containing protein [Fundicoccus sp. Sow4_F4]|uniref:glycoside hydrolase family 3 protein n=1 Tax=Fundicoccus sp. Sow4_F4 TaxID=3438783 RepID=UPI003F922CE1